MYEGAIRVPFMVQWKGRLPSGRVYDKPVSSMDIFATASAIAGAKTPKQVEGVDLIPFLTGKDNGRPHQTLYWRQGGKTALRHGDWKLVRMGKRFEPGNAKWELYDLSKDISEERNLATSHPERLTELVEQWEKMYAQLAEFRKVNGHGKVPSTFDENPALGKWVVNQRVSYRAANMSLERQKRLEDLEFLWMASPVDRSNGENEIPSGQNTAARSIVFERNDRSITMILDNPSSIEKIGPKLQQLMAQDKVTAKVFGAGEKREKRLRDGLIYRAFSNDRIGVLPEKQFAGMTISWICSVDDRQPIVFKVEYVEVQNDVSDDE